MIIRNSIKNYIKSLKYFLPALSIILILLFIGLSKAFKQTYDDINKLLNMLDNSNNQISFNTFREAIFDEFKALDWSNFWGLIKELFSPQFLNNLITKVVILLIGEDNYSSSIANETTSLVTTLSNGLILCILLFLIGIIISYFYISIHIKKDLNVKLPLKIIVIITIVNFIINATLVALITYLLGILPIGAALAFIITIFINQAIFLFDAYISRDDKTIKFREIFNLKNISSLVIGTIIISLISSFLVYLSVLLTNQTFAFIFTIPLYIILINVIKLNAYNYVLNYN